MRDIWLTECIYVCDYFESEQSFVVTNTYGATIKRTMLLYRRLHINLKMKCCGTTSSPWTLFDSIPTFTVIIRCGQTERPRWPASSSLGVRRIKYTRPFASQEIYRQHFPVSWQSPESSRQSQVMLHCNTLFDSGSRILIRYRCHNFKFCIQLTAKHAKANRIMRKHSLFNVKTCQKSPIQCTGCAE